MNQLYELAKNGDISAKNNIIVSCDKTIKNKALIAYESIRNSLQYYNTNIPSSILDIDEIIQDFRIKSYHCLNLFLLLNTKSKYFTTYLNHALSSYIKSYKKIKVDEIITRLNNEYNLNINFQYNFNNDNNESIRIEIIKTISKDKKLSKYIDFINAIFDKYSYNELIELFNIEPKRIGSKIDTFSNLYKNYLINHSEITLKQYIESGNMFDDIKNYRLFELLYFKKEIIFMIHDTYYILSKKYDISYKLIKEELCMFLYKCLKKDDYTNYNIDNFDIYLNKVLKLVKDNYLLYKDKQLKDILLGKFNEYKYNDKVINKDEVCNFIKEGNIYIITPYKEYIDMFIQKIYKELNNNIYIELKIITKDITMIINNYIKKSVLMLNLPLETFNSNFISHLDRKGRLYIEKKLSKKIKER